MPIIKTNVYIHAPINCCFDLARNVEAHTKTTLGTKEKAIGGVTSGLLNEGDIVTWEATHFWIRHKLTAKIIHMEYPYKFTDTMVRGIFKSFTHTHEFVEVNQNETIMIDIFEYRSPFGIVGNIADYLFLEKYMRKFLENRGKELKKLAENIQM
ncbi:SRPBCC family protein [Ornithinibacillus sp. 179-J 7C1 HS]|uniref:SRPBCC family protein n=1 Tax=Ornithinibacillus sp. 179-J 7C1 HS TaxID=3142384 RepID=UPI0039A0CD29